MTMWRVIQAIAASGEDGGVLPVTASELRAMCYQALTWGCKGLTYFSYTLTAPENESGKGLYRSPTLAQMYRTQAAEISSLNDILVLPTDDYSWHYRRGSRVTFSNSLSGWNSHENFNYIIKHDSGASYLIVVNKDARSVSSTTISITGLGLTGSLSVITLGAAIGGNVPGQTFTTSSISNGVSFTDNRGFPGLGVKIYKIATSSLNCSFRYE
jgi:hypothetical protein